MRFILLVLLILIPFNISVAGVSPSGKKYFDMTVTEWLELPESEQVVSTQALLSVNQKDLTRQQELAVVSCMKAIGRSPIWESSTVGTLMTKCSFDMGVTKSPSEKEWDALVECVKKEVPDFTKQEFFSLGLSAAGAALAKDAGSDPILTPRNQKVLGVINRCGKK
ncbi:MAG: hypothetical protein H6Q57_2176 [Geobacteraceae bacterium]|jgi:hypothetical protein|nr:hypothetical protein [Geobacteraceae bacterium]